MENYILTTVAFVVGILVGGLCLIFLSPIVEDFSGTPGNPWRSVLGILLTGALVTVVTYSKYLAATVLAISSGYVVFLLSYNLKKRARRKAAISREFPLFLDNLLLQVEAGYSIHQALNSSIRLFLPDSHLHQILVDLNESLDFGRPMGEALVKFAQDLEIPEAEVTIRTLCQAMIHGTPLGMVLREQNKRIRQILILKGEQFANTVSVKILIPLLFFIFPASFLVILSPVIVSFW